jgi:hypothetical protein
MDCMNRVSGMSGMSWRDGRPHLGGALRALWLQALLSQCWLKAPLYCRALTVTRLDLTCLTPLLETS